MRFDAIVGLCNAAGLASRGAFHSEPADGIPPLTDGRPAATVLLLGFIGSATWPVFAASPEARDARPDPLDRWSCRVIEGLASQLGAAALYPFGGPPYLPFQRWARRAEPVHPSPLGLLIHPDWGLWHSYRGALAFRERLDLPPREDRPSPCDGCAAKPCLTTCPVGAFTASGYDTAACVAHIGSAAGRDCIDEGCRARRACPVGAALRLVPEQAAHHMRAFRASFR
jgi:ferredoxin